MIRDLKSEAYAQGQKKLSLGHGGTLDPFADGLLLLLVGQATRLMDLMHPTPKTYVAQVAWGVETDSCDLQGLPIFRGDATSLEPTALEAALTPFLGWTDQVPPATSAKKIDGEAAYKKAHRGEVVEMRPSRVYLHQARWLSHDLAHPDGPRSTLELTCKGGYYVRSLARDLGQALGCGAHLGALRRTAIGPWGDPGPQARPLVTGEALVPWCPSRDLSDAELDHLLHGRSIPLWDIEPATWSLPEGFPDPNAPIRAMHQGRLMALLRPQDGALRTFANLRGGL